MKGLNIDELIAFDPEIILQEIGEIPEEQKKYVYFFKDAVLDDDPRTVEQRIRDELEPLGYHIEVKIQDAILMQTLFK